MGYIRSFNHTVTPQLFSTAAPRDLRLLFDEVAPPLSGNPHVVDFLHEVTKHAFVFRLRYAGSSASSGLERINDGSGGKSTHRESVEITEVHTDGAVSDFDYWATWSVESSHHSARIDHVLLADVPAREFLRTERPIANSGPRNEFLDAILAVGVARATKSDLLVTSRELLLDDDSLVSKGVAVGDAEFALVMTTLHLRSRGIFPIYTGASALELSRDLFFHAASYAAIPAGHALWAATLENERNGAPDGLTYLVQAVMNRVSRSLQARDGLLTALFGGGRSGGQADVALYSFDTSMLFLSGAFDACAALVDEYLVLNSRPMSIGWARGPWLARVGTHAQRISELMEPGSEATALIQIIGALRNTVHGEGMDLTQYRSDIDGDVELLRLPSRAGETFRKSMLIADPTGRVDVRELVPGRVYVEPISAIRFLYPKFLSLLNGLVGEVARLALPTGQGLDIEAHPLTKETAGNVIFTEASAQSIRAQLWI